MGAIAVGLDGACLDDGDLAAGAGAAGRRIEADRIRSAAVALALEARPKPAPPKPPPPPTDWAMMAIESLPVVVMVPVRMTVTSPPLPPSPPIPPMASEAATLPLASPP